MRRALRIGAGLLLLTAAVVMTLIGVNIMFPAVLGAACYGIIFILGFVAVLFFATLPEKMDFEE